MKEIYFETVDKALEIINDLTERGYNHADNISTKSLKKDIKTILKLKDVSLNPSLSFTFGIGEDEETKTFLLFLKQTRYESKRTD